MTSLPAEVTIIFLELLEPGMRLFARLVCREWWELIPFRYPPYKIFWYLIEKDYVELIRYLAEHGYTRELKDTIISSGKTYLADEFICPLKGTRVKTIGSVEMMFWLTKRGIKVELEYLRPWRVVDDISDNTFKYDNLESIQAHPEYPIQECIKKSIAYRALRIFVHCLEVGNLTREELLIHYISATRYSETDILKYLDQEIGGLQQNEYPLLQEGIEYRSAETLLFYYKKGYVDYHILLALAVKDDSMTLLAWLRGEKDDTIPPPWPPGIIRFAKRNHVIHWLRSPERLHGPCPWDSMLLVDAVAEKQKEFVKFLISREDKCPWNPKALEIAIMHEDLDLIGLLRQGNDPCPWPEDMRELVLHRAHLYKTLKALGSPFLPLVK